MQLPAAGVQDHFAVPDFSIRYSILVGIFDHVSSQRFSDSWYSPVQQTGGNSMAVERHLAQLDAARAPSNHALAFVCVDQLFPAIY
jgi:hypothetical protein